MFDPLPSQIHFRLPALLVDADAAAKSHPVMIPGKGRQSGGWIQTF